MAVEFLVLEPPQDPQANISSDGSMCEKADPPRSRLAVLYPALSTWPTSFALPHTLLFTSAIRYACLKSASSKQERLIAFWASCSCIRLGSTNTYYSNASPSTPTSILVMCHRPRLAVNSSLPRNAQLVGWQSVCASGSSTRSSISASGLTL